MLISEPCPPPYLPPSLTPPPLPFPPESQAKIRSVKASLSHCKSLLRCKREELKRLWLDDVKFKNMLQIIDGM